ncbi:MAG: hypothetical protein KDB79_06190 [Acidobacteria bacterium]|nr:hypothetical protein [Acidobacteriota bacterium]
MGSEGANVFKSGAGDVISTERQKQMVKLIEELKKYNPTKIAIACDIEAKIAGAFGFPECPTKK